MDLICATASAMAVLVGVPVMALVNMSITIQRLITSPCWRVGGAGHDVSLPVSSTFWNGLTRGSMSHSGTLSNPCRNGAKYMSPEAIQGRYTLGSMVQRRNSLAASMSLPYANTPCVTGTSAWYRWPVGPLGLRA